MTKNHVIGQMKRHRLKMTRQRKHIIDVLLDNQMKLLSVEDIAGALDANVKLNITTIYRNLEKFETVGLIHRTVLDNQMTYYKLNCGGHHHHHLICKQCGSITIIDYCPLTRIQPLAEAQGFLIGEHKLEVYGRCKQCQSEM